MLLRIFELPISTSFLGRSPPGETLFERVLQLFNLVKEIMIYLLMIICDLEEEYECNDESYY